MRPTVSQYAQTLEELSLGKTGEEIVLLSRNFLAFLKRRGEEKKLTAIVHHLEKLHREKAGEVMVTVTLAHTADTMTEENIMLEVQKLFPEKKITLVYQIDKEAIGGVHFHTDELLYSATVADALTSLKQSFLKA